MKTLVLVLLILSLIETGAKLTRLSGDSYPRPQKARTRGDDVFSVVVNLVYIVLLAALYFGVIGGAS